MFKLDQITVIQSRVLVGNCFLVKTYGTWCPDISSFDFISHPSLFGRSSGAYTGMCPSK